MTLLPGPMIRGPKRNRFGPWLRRGIAFLIGVLLVRIIGFERFEVASGSMAPLLMGPHRACACPKCGERVIVGVPGPRQASSGHWRVNCPRCGHNQLGLENQPNRPGMRLWVNKLAYDFRRPRRWELVIFRGFDRGCTPTVKRVVGLPGESVMIRYGRVYINGVDVGVPPGVRFPAIADKDGNYSDYFVYNGAQVPRVEEVDPASVVTVDSRPTRGVHYQQRGRHAVDGTWRLGLDDYFVLGDNSVSSIDSRGWYEPGVKHERLIGKPILLNWLQDR